MTKLIADSAVRQPCGEDAPFFQPGWLPLAREFGEPRRVYPLRNGRGEHIATIVSYDGGRCRLILRRRGRWEVAR